VIRGNDLNRAAGLEGRALSVQADFMKLAPFADNSFDGVYAIEATCHAPVREGVYSQIYRVLKPGQIFACYEWCLTPKYDANNELHRTIKKKIEEGDGLPDMASQQECVDALTSVGFEVRIFAAMCCDLCMRNTVVPTGFGTAAFYVTFFFAWLHTIMVVAKCLLSGLRILTFVLHIATFFCAADRGARHGPGQHLRRRSLVAAPVPLVQPLHLPLPAVPRRHGPHAQRAVVHGADQVRDCAACCCVALSCVHTLVLCIDASAALARSNAGSWHTCCDMRLYRHTTTPLGLTYVCDVLCTDWCPREPTRCRRCFSRAAGDARRAVIPVPSRPCGSWWRASLCAKC
jgi:hypothetical protein